MGNLAGLPQPPFETEDGGSYLRARAPSSGNNSGSPVARGLAATEVVRLAALCLALVLIRFPEIEESRSRMSMTAHTGFFRMYAILPFQTEELTPASDH